MEEATDAPGTHFSSAKQRGSNVLHFAVGRGIGASTEEEEGGMGWEPERKRVDWLVRLGYSRHIGNAERKKHC